MGLDWTPLAKPKSGHDAEFETLWRQVNESEGKLRPINAKGFWSTIWLSFLNREPNIDVDAVTARFQEISIPAYVNLGAPVVGKDDEADAWVLELHTSGELKGSDDMTPAQALSEFQGLHILQLLPECDGLPLYTNADMYEGVDRTSFRGQFLQDCTNVIGKEMLSRAWEPMLACDLAAYGEELRVCADRFAIESGHPKVVGDRAFEWKDEGDPASQLHVVDQAARWCLFWSVRGHGLAPYF